MKIIIIEDELPAFAKLKALLYKFDKDIQILSHLTSVESSVQWFQNHQDVEIQVVFMDIQLTDGLSLDIFKSATIKAPIIFTTAFDEYAIDAFKVNGIDYLLKPLTYTDLSRALNKLKNLSGILPQSDKVQALALKFPKKQYRDRFMVKVGTKIQVLSDKDIAYCNADGRTLYVHTYNSKKYILDFSLTEIEEQLDPSSFYRVNRSYIVQMKSIDSVSVYSNSRLKLNTTPSSTEEIIVSREKVSDFKKWWSGD